MGATGGLTPTMTIAVLEPALFVHVSVNVVALASVIVREEPFVSVPTPLSSEQVGVGVGLFAYVQLHVTAVGAPIVTLAGFAVSVESTGATGAAVVAICTVRVAVPALFVHVSVYVVATVCVTLVACPLVTGPTLLLIEQSGAGVGELEYVHAQVTFVATPLVTEDGVAVNEASAGATGAAVTPIVTCALSLPAAFVQVSVYVVATVCVTLAVAPLAIAPTPWSMVQSGAGDGVLV